MEFLTKLNRLVKNIIIKVDLFNEENTNVS